MNQAAAGSLRLEWLRRGHLPGAEGARRAAISLVPHPSAIGTLPLRSVQAFSAADKRIAAFIEAEELMNVPRDPDANRDSNFTGGAHSVSEPQFPFLAEI